LKTKISLIAAVADNGVIGDGKGMPWRIKSELQAFRRLTLGKPVVMGRKTFETLKAPLKDRANIVVTRDAGYARPGVIVTTSLEKALDVASNIAMETGAGEVMVIGGADIYRQALPLADRLYITEIHAEPEGDILFPVFDKNLWVEKFREHRPAQENETSDYTVTMLERR